MEGTTGCDRRAAEPMFGTVEQMLELACSTGVGWAA
jgi:hypothetical protein